MYNYFYLFVSKTMLADIKEEIVCLYSTLRQNKTEQLYSKTKGQESFLFYFVLFSLFELEEETTEKGGKKKTIASC